MSQSPGTGRWSAKQVKQRSFQTLLTAKALENEAAAQQQYASSSADSPLSSDRAPLLSSGSLRGSPVRQPFGVTFAEAFRDDWAYTARSPDRAVEMQASSTGRPDDADTTRALPNLLRGASLGAAESLRQFTEPSASQDGPKLQRLPTGNSPSRDGGTTSKSPETVAIQIEADSRTSSYASADRPLLGGSARDARFAGESTAFLVKRDAAGPNERNESAPTPHPPPVFVRPPLEKQDSLLEEFDDDYGGSVKLAEPNLLCKPEFWVAAIPGIITVALVIAGIALIRLAPDRRLLYLDASRWCFFFAGMAPIYYSSEVIVHLLVMVVESRFFTTAQALYFAVSIQQPVARLLRAVMLLPLFMITFSDGTDGPPPVQHSWRIIIKLLVCLVLFAGANVLKTLLAKVMASHFHQKAHFEKMQDALNKEFFLHSLSQPRPHEEAGISAAMAATGMDPHARHKLPGKGLHHMRSMSYAVYAEVFDAMHTMSQSVSQSVAHSLKPSAWPERQVRSPRAAGGYTAAFHTVTSESDLVGLADKSDRRNTDAGGALAADSSTAFAGKVASKELGSSERRPGTQTPPGTAGSRAFASTQREPGAGNSPRQPRAASQEPNPLLRRGSLNPADTDFMRRLHNLERHIRENKLKMTFTDELGMAQADSDGVGSKKEAKKLAFYLFWNVRQSFDRNYIVFEDLVYFLPAEKAAQALKVLDVDGDGKISLPDIRDAVIQIYKERKNLAFTLKDTRTVVGKLEFITGIVVHILFIFFYLIIFNVNLGQVWLTFSSIVLAFVFVFGNSIRIMYESVIFLFVVHPFDVGDVLLVNGDWCKVEEIALQNTILLRWDGVKIWQPNHILSNGAVMNVSRSANRWEGFKVAVDVRTTPDVFDQVEQAVTAFFKANPTEYTGEKLVVANFAGDPLKFTLCVWWEYSHSGVELGRMSRARHALYMVVSKALVAANVAYTLPPYPDMAFHSSAHRPGPERPLGEGQAFMPPFMQKSALKL
ncbi:hypothetical protein WJX72_003976 [[Myrmecia] bisecta]|uniref:EF-hand domain-containing protein n=1 Tax=[Myrmecia] bisecta TaxID=41462 RepID=A0AAW1QQ74_9CHLO